jgi:integrase
MAPTTGASNGGSADRVAQELQKLRDHSVYDADGDLVFCHPESGSPLDRLKLTRRFKQTIKRAEVREITFHELRHTFGTRMAAAGVPLRTIQHRMGHAERRRHRSTPTTSPPTTRPTRWIRRSQPNAARRGHPRPLGDGAAAEPG